MGPGRQPDPLVSDSEAGEAHATATPPAKPRLPTCSARGEELIGASGTTLDLAEGARCR